MGCYDNIPIENLGACTNVELASGVSETDIYYAPVDFIDQDAEPTALGTTGATFEQLGKISTDITFLSGKGFKKLRIMPETGEVKDELTGNKGNKKVKQSFEFMIANTDATLIGFVRQYKNVPMVVLVRERTGRIRKIGSKANPAFFDAVSITTGKTAEDDSGMTLTVTAVSGSPAPEYAGAITEMT